MYNLLTNDYQHDLLYTILLGVTVFGNVHRRFFVLFGSFLTYYKTHTARTPTRDECIDVRACSVTSIDNHELGEYAIRIHHQRGTVYMLLANNQHIRKTWYNVLLHAAVYNG